MTTGFPSGRTDSAVLLTAGLHPTPPVSGDEIGAGRAVASHSCQHVKMWENVLAVITQGSWVSCNSTGSYDSCNSTG